MLMQMLDRVLINVVQCRLISAIDLVHIKLVHRLDAYQLKLGRRCISTEIVDLYTVGFLSWCVTILPLTVRKNNFVEKFSKGGPLENSDTKGGPKPPGLGLSLGLGYPRQTDALWYRVLGLSGAKREEGAKGAKRPPCSERSWHELTIKPALCHSAVTPNASPTNTKNFPL